MGFKSDRSYNNTEKPLRYWAQLAAIRLIMRDAEDPATVLDALFEPIQSVGTIASSGVRSSPKKGS